MAPEESAVAPENVRAVMRGNRRRDTSPELAVRRLLHAAGLRYRVDFPLPFDRRRRVDVAFTRRRIAVFIDGCFWHGCPLHYRAAKSDPQGYWAAKLLENQRRDRETDRLLSEAGWTVLRFWEHDDPRAVVEEIQGTLMRAESEQDGGRRVARPVYYRPAADRT